MTQASYMLPKELIKEVEDLCYKKNITQDEIVRRAVAEYVARESLSGDAKSLPQEIRTRVINRGMFVDKLE